MARLTVNGIGLNVEVAGTGPPLLLLHGFTGRAATWARHLPELSGRATTIAVDLIGHGASDAPADPARYTMSHCIADLLAVLDRLEIGRAAVLGYSMGARVALHLARAAPERVVGLVLESGSPGLAGESERSARRARDEELAATIERDGVRAFVARWEQLPLFASQSTLPAEVRSALRRQRLRNNAQGLAHSLRGMGTGAQASLWSRLGEIDAPALLIVGALDEKFCRIGRAMAGAMPRARLAVVPGAGHAVHLEQPDEFNRLVVGFTDACDCGRMANHGHCGAPVATGAGGLPTAVGSRFAGPASGVPAQSQAAHNS
jgi:2-succinyl-6-hydroxy-2,4-cyclohexadiene-1-carboxylate synthase